MCSFVTIKAFFFFTLGLHSNIHLAGYWM